MDLFLYIIIGIVVGALIDIAILLLFEGIKKLTDFLTGDSPDDESLNSLMLIAYNIAIVIILAVVFIVIYFITN